MKDLNRLEYIFLAFLSGYLLQLINGAKLVINPSGETQNQPAGTGFGLTCEGEAENTDLFSDMKWIGPRGDLTPGSPGSGKVSKLGNTLILMFQLPSTEDSGMYNCSANYDNVDLLSASVNLVFYQDITWEDCPEEQALVIHRDEKVRCRVSANPPATITWSKDGQNLEDRYITETDGVRVSGVTQLDKGEFQVRAMVPQTGRFQNRIIKVEVNVPPEIIDLNEKAEATEGSETTLNCQANGFPKPRYSWLDKNQRNLSNVEGYIVDQDNGRLTILSVKRDDHGSYTCKANNPAGEKKGSLDLTVIIKPEIREFANITAVQGKIATFECQAYGDPAPEMSIRKDGQDRPFSDADDRIRLSRRNEADKSVLSLIIQNSVRSDDGLYYCTAENKADHVEKVGHLTIEFGPVMSQTPSTVVKTWNGNAVNLTCVAESIPNATIKWSYVGQEIRNDDVYTVYGNSAHSNLLVRPPPKFSRDGVNVYGTYKCEADNIHGDQFINIELQEARPPSSLLDTEVMKTTATTITFKFHGPRDDGGLPIRAFVVKYHEENQPLNEGQVREWSEGTPYVLDNLKPRTVYKFQFAARNEAGIGEYSDEKRIVMPSESAPEPPIFITPGGNVGTYPDRFQIRWTVPLNNGRKIDYFELRYFEVEKRDNTFKPVSNSISQKVTDWENAPMYEMKSLKANTHYKVEVRAHNDIGFSFVATMVFQTAAGSEESGISGGYHGGSGSGLTAGAIAAIIIVVILVILVVLDIACFVRYKWGVLFLLRTRVCAKPIVDNKAKEAAAEEGKGGGSETVANNGDIKNDAKDSANTKEKGDMDKKSRTEVDNPAFDKEKELLRLKEEAENNDTEVATEDTPMIQTSGAKDSKPNDNTEDVKNKSPKGSKSSIAKDSLV